MSPGRSQTPPPSSPTSSVDPSSPRSRATTAAAEPFEAAFAPFHLAIGSSLSAEELMIGWQDSLGSRDPKHSEFKLLASELWFRAFASSYSTDALNPLDAQFDYSDLTDSGIFVSKCGLLGPGGSPAIDITFHLHRPPRFWVIVNGVRRRGTERDTLLDGGFEADGVARGYDTRNFKGVTCLGEPSALRLGRWLSYRFSLPASDLPRLKAALKELNLVRSFPLLQQSFGIIVDFQVDQLLELLKKEITEDPEKAERILHSFFRSTRIWDLEQRIKDVKPFILARPKRPPQAHMVFVAKAVVTPTRVLLFPPECQTSNAVLSAFPEQAKDGRFIRVQFWDEGNRLNMGFEKRGDDADANEGILARFRRALEHGLEFAGRKYVALDYSASQARTNAFWAICEDSKNGFTRVRVRAVLGDFSTEKIVAKHAARRGQLYSTTRDVGVVDAIGRIADYKTDDGEYTFTDGVGICTQEIATRAASTLGFPPAISSRTSAIQVRLGGIKGMLAVWPQRPVDFDGEPLFPDLDWPEVGPSFEPRHDILVRPSQEKFVSNQVNLGVVRVSVFSHAYLNREVLTLLFPRGVRYSDVTKRFEHQINEIMGSEDHLVQGKGMRPYHHRLFSSSKVPVGELLDAGFQQEPFVRALARLFANRALWDLKWKARIHVEQGVNLLGVVDELGTLEEDQVYCRTVDRDGNEHTVLGKCIIFRAPTRHPGDVQIVEAVDSPALRAAGLTNVIIFNRMGDRDLPSMLGGGDLDGDDYTLLWDGQLTSIRPHEPMDYTPEQEPVKVDEVMSKDVRAFHTSYMKLDTLGAVSNAHLSLADQLGPEHPDCLELCELHSIAVDFAKSALFFFAPQMPELRPEQWPDFMGPRVMGNIYESKKPIGVMFRHPQLSPLPPREPVRQTCLDPRLAKIPVPMIVLEMAIRLKGAYDLEVHSLMLQFQAREEEVVAGVVLELPGGLRRTEKDSKMRDPLTMAYDSVRFDYVKRVTDWANLGKSSGSPGFSRLEVMAVAAYRATHDQAVAELDPSKRMISFPFVFKEVLIELVTRET